MRRAFEIACVATAAVLLTLFLVVDDDYRLLVMAGWFATFLAAGLPLLIANLRLAAVPPELRPQRFVVSPKGFVAPYEHDLRYIRGPLLLVVVAFVAMAIDSGSAVFIMIAPAAIAASRFGKMAITLTSAGVIVRDTASTAPRTIAWGEPLEVPRELAVNPWFVSAAIKWYADHPDERAGIGTRPGHERLRQALGAKDPVRPRRPPLPRNLVLASWFTWAGVATGILTAIADIVLAVVLRSVRVGDDDGFFLLFATAGWLFVAIVAGLFAVVVLVAVRRGGNEPARVALMFLAGGALLVAANPLASPLLSLTDFNPHLGVLRFLAWLAGRAALGAAALAALIQLASAPVREFSRPQGSPGPPASPIGGSVRP